MILLDSDIVIAHLRGHRPARDWLLAARARDPLAISVLTVSEVSGGMRTGERREVWGLLSSFHTEPVTETVARRAGEFQRTYRRSHHTIGTVDYLIAATAAVHGYELATLNVRHFPMFTDLVPPFPA